jgi:hypothetical protein
MSFSVDYTVRPIRVLYENDDVRICVGQINRSRKRWEFHSEPAASLLKKHKHDELMIFGWQQAELKEITERLTK